MVVTGTRHVRTRGREILRCAAALGEAGFRPDAGNTDAGRGDRQRQSDRPPHPSQSDHSTRIVQEAVQSRGPHDVHEMQRSAPDAHRPAPSARGGDVSGPVTDVVAAAVVPPPTDHALVASMAGGDEGAMQLLVQRYGGVVFALVRTILREPADAEEVAADAFMQAWRRAATFDPVRSSVVGWLGMIARSRALDRLRSQNRQGKYLTQESEFTQVDASREAQGDVLTPDRAAEQSEARTLVAGALRDLPDTQREVIELAYFGGLSQSEIAARLSMPLGTVKTRTLAALKQLRARLGPLLREELA